MIIQLYVRPDGSGTARIDVDDCFLKMETDSILQDAYMVAKDDGHDAVASVLLKCMDAE